MKTEITVYGTDACKDTRRTREHLQHLGVRHRYVDIDEDDAAEQRVLEWNEGRRRTPTLVLAADERTVIVSVPSDTTLDVELDRLKALPDRRRGDGSPALGE